MRSKCELCDEWLDLVEEEIGVTLYCYRCGHMYAYSGKDENEEWIINENFKCECEECEAERI